MKQVITGLLDSMGLKYKDSGQDFLLTQCMSEIHDDSNPSMFIQTEIGYGRCQGCGYEVFPETFIKDETTLEHHQLVSGYQQIKKKLELEELVEGEEIFFLPPNSGEELKEYRGISKDTLKACGVYKCTRGRYENRIIFPFYTKNGALVGYTARWLQKEGEELPSSFPKYLHAKNIKTSQHILYAKAIVELTLDPSTLIVTEGVMDALAFIDRGVASTTSLGFRVPDDYWVLEAIALGVDKVVLAWDADSAGLEHMSKLFHKWNEKIPTQLGYYNPKTMLLYKQDKFKDFHEMFTSDLFKINK